MRAHLILPVTLLVACLISNAAAKEGPKIPEGVILVKLPPGQVRMEFVLRDGRPRLRVTVGQTVIEARTFFFGDGKGAMQIEAIKEGMLWLNAKGKKIILIDGSDTHEPGSAINEEDFFPVTRIKAGSLYVTSPSIIFRWGKDETPKR